MSNKISRFFGRMFATIIQYTVGLVMPWWLIDGVNDFLIDSYEERFDDYSNWHKYTYGAILPWWIMFLIVKTITKNNEKKQEQLEQKLDELEAQRDYQSSRASDNVNSLDIDDGELNTQQDEKSALKSKKEEKVKAEKNFYCKQCGFHVVDVKSPIGKHGKCNAEHFSNHAHSWVDMGKVGEYRSQCQLCGVTIDHEQQSIYSMKCILGNQHKWKRLN